MMSLDKTFEQFKLAAMDVKALLLELDDNIQPTVNEVNQMQEKLQHLSEQLVIYKYLKGAREISPNLDIHLKVMEQAAVTAEVKEELNPPDKTEPVSPASVKRVELNLNDKFRIINELFKQSSTEFNLALDQLNTFTSFEKSRIYLDELKKLYGWRDDHEMAVKLYQLNQKRFQ